MKKKLSFWERILGFYNEPRHRVICLLGLKIKIRSKYLMLRERMSEQEHSSALLQKDFIQWRREMTPRIAGLESMVREQASLISTLTEELAKFRAEQADEHRHCISDICELKESLAAANDKLKTEVAKSADMQKLLIALEHKNQEQEKQIEDIVKEHSASSLQLATKLSKVDASLGALEKRTQWNRTDALGRISAAERRLRYMIHKYCPEEKRAEALGDWYREIRGETLNLDKPQTFNEKIQWMKLYDSTPIKTQLADKYLVRDWVAERIGVQYLIPLLGVWDGFDEIDFDALPERFVLKCNHGSGYNLIVKNKAELNMEDAKRKINTWLREDFAFRAGFELHYSPIPRKIIAEEFIENKDSGDLFDYKFWCFNGKVEYIQFLSERNISGLKMAFYDRSWVKQNFVYSFPLDEKTIERPENLDEMILLAEKLSEGFSHVRVDFYRMDDGRIYFGEMTFTSASGCCNWQPAEMDYTMGQILQLPIKE